MKKINFMFGFLFMIIFLLTGISYFFSTQKKYSVEEGRMFSTIPRIDFFHLKDSNEVKQLEIALQDQFFSRNLFLEIQTKIQKMSGKKEKNNVYFGKNGSLLEKVNETKKKEKFIGKINQFYQDHNDINMSLLLLPSHITIEPDLIDHKIPHFDQYEEMKQIYHQIQFNTIDVVPILKKNAKEYPMYYQLDSHLTSYGAYYIYQAYSAQNDLKPLTMSDFDIEEVTDSFSGNLVKQTYLFSSPKDSIVQFTPKNNPVLEINGNGTLYNQNALKTDSKYSYFLGKNIPIMTIVNKKLEDQKEILIIKDESANVIIPFLINHYYKIHILDSNLYQKSISNYLKEHKEIKDILFIYNLNELDHEIEMISFN